MPYHELNSYSGSPDSAIVGTLGSCAERRAPVTANARTYFSCTSRVTVAIVPM